MREQIRHVWGRWWSGLLRRLRQLSPQERRLLRGALALGAVAGLAVLTVLPRITNASQTDVLVNGSFEQGFAQVPGCGIVGEGWGCFTNGGAANYGFYDDSWELVVADGKHSQLVEINTNNLAAGDPDRYAGIYQTVRVVPGEQYKLALRGMIRTTNQEGDPWRYRVQVGYLHGPHGDWRDVENWTDVGWNTYYGRTEPGSFSDYHAVLVPDSQALTIFIRVWKKWGVAYEELDVNLDAISLVGPSPHRPGGPPQAGGTGGPVGGDAPAPGRPDDGPRQPAPQDGPDYGYGPAQNQPLLCTGPDLLYNGSFEQGFADTPLGAVGRGWGAFTNGGGAIYGFYDEQWTPVVADGKHGQLIEINTKGVYPTDADRYAGIYQRVEGLHPGGVYELTLRGLLRGEGNEEDPYRFAAQWGYGPNPDWRHVDEEVWEEMDLGPIYKRTEPGSLATYTARFTAPSSSVVLFIRGWKKFAVTNVEMDFNVDAIRLRACQPAGVGGPDQRPNDGPDGGPDGGPGRPGPGGEPGGASCLYVVKPGDSLGAIAQYFGVSAQAIMRANGIENADLIYVGQKFEIPGCGAGGPPAGQGAPEQPQDAPRPQGQEEPLAPSRPQMRPDEPDRDEGRRPQRGQTYTIRNGDTLSAIAAAYGVDAYALARYNGIDNLNLIYVGQVLQIPAN
ncbi:MAG TPA: LysM peptidoglycan-binding domain-containing protein [Caldilineaceae bacterium]|nr:LysM peptidoglycan-binding domain-containing protein [Caldilineaceae bacterium]